MFILDMLDMAYVELQHIQFAYLRNKSHVVCGSNDAVRIASIQLRRINIGNKGQVWTGVCLQVNSGGSVLCVIH